MAEQSEFAKEFMREAPNVGGIKNMADAVGMPDDEDKKLLLSLVQIYERKTGGLLSHTVRNARKDFDSSKYSSAFNEHAVVNKESSMRYDFELPESFIAVVEKHWPTMFRDRKHYQWFKKVLPELLIKP